MTPEEIKKMQADNLKLQKELEQQKEENKRLGNEAASALSAVNEKATGKRVLRRTPGSVKIVLMPAEGGKVKHTEMKIADGYPYLSIDSKSNTTAESTVVMKIAMGQELTEKEQETNAAVASWSKKDAVEFLTAHAAKQVSWLVPVEAAQAAFTCIILSTQQISNMSFNDMLVQCGQRRPPGLRSKLYWTLKEEILNMPATRAALGGVLPGDAKIYDEPFAFVATVGLGYWRQMDILVDTGDLKETGEGEISSLKHMQTVDFFLEGNSAVQQENLDTLVAHSGCLIGLIPTQTGEFHVVGDLLNPVFVKPYEGGSGGNRVGYAMSLMANTGYASMLYDADTHGINITPNV